MPPSRRVVVAELLAGGDAEHLAHQVDAGDLLGHRVLDLQPGVDLEEADRAVLADQELTGARPDVAGLAQDGLRALPHRLDLLVGQVRRGRLLDQLLVPPLQRAVAGGDDDHAAVAVGQALGLDVSRLVQVALDEALAPPERRLRLAHRRLVHVRDLVLGPRDLEPASAAAEGGLDRDRQPVLGGERLHLVDAVHRVGGAGHQRSAHLLRDVPGLHLVAERGDRVRRRADPDQAGVDDGAREVGVLGEEAVARVHGVGVAALGRGDDLVDREVRVTGGRAVQGVRLVGQSHEQGVAVGVGVDRHAPDPRVAAGPDDAHRDLPAVRDQHLGELTDLLRHDVLLLDATAAGV